MVKHGFDMVVIGASLSFFSQFLHNDTGIVTFSNKSSLPGFVCRAGDARGTDTET